MSNLYDLIKTVQALHPVTETAKLLAFLSRVTLLINATQNCMNYLEINVIC